MSQESLLASHGWLLTQPIAHRGLHGPLALENTLAAVEAAVAGAHPIECDIQLSRDGELLVFHDLTLRRLANKNLIIPGAKATSLQRYSLEDGYPMPLLKDFLWMIAGRVPVLIELKSPLGRDSAMVRALEKALRGYSGEVALQSFDLSVVKLLKKRSPLPVGLLLYSYRKVNFSKPKTSAFLPDFIAGNYHKITPHRAEKIQNVLGLPLLLWTIRTPAEAQIAALLASNYIFEGFSPPA